MGAAPGGAAAVAHLHDASSPREMQQPHLGPQPRGERGTGTRITEVSRDRRPLR